jgi:hypothetical protein
MVSTSLTILATCLVTPAGPRAAEAAHAHSAGVENSYDVVVYGGTASGVVAAVQAKRLGKTVALIELGKHLGGLTSGGLGATDIGNKAAIGGTAREFYRRVAQHYDRPEAWKYQTRESYRSNRQRADETEMWTFEPHVAERILREMIREADVPVFFGERLDLKNGVVKSAGRVESITMESGRQFRAKMFIDATYEGDLMAEAGVSYTVGREANATYAETLNGVQTKNATHHQFIKPVDPYLKPGDPSSGLLPGIDPNGPGEEGAGDHRVQTYNLRICATDVSENRRPWPKPADYDPLKYELLLRNFEAGDHRVPWNPILMPNRKTDSNNNYAVSTDYIGQNYQYPDGDYATRDRIIAEHLSYTAGLMWTLANSPRVPEQVRRHFNEWGLAKDEFLDNDNWPHQLYVREARRMVSDYVMTQHNCQGRAVADDSVGLAAYTMDSHNTQRCVKDGRVLNEGDVQVGGFSPYPISYRSIVPREKECTNLFVPVCLAATHISYGSIRMEPVFMVLGQSAASAACHAIDERVPVQRIDFAKLRERLIADKQILAWTGPATSARTGLDPKKLPGIVIDDRDAELTGDWSHSSSIAGFVGTDYLHDGNEGKGDKRVRFKLAIKTAGRYEVRVSYTSNPNRATNVPVTIRHADGTTSRTVNQKSKPDAADGFMRVGTYRFTADAESYVEISNAETDGHVIVDAVQLLPVQ